MFLKFWVGTVNKHFLVVILIHSFFTSIKFVKTVIRLEKSKTDLCDKLVLHKIFNVYFTGIKKLWLN